MPTPSSDPAPSPSSVPQPKPTSFVDWFHVNSRWVAVGGVAVAIAGLVAWYVPHQRALASENAGRMLMAAKQSLNSGNQQLAESDLRKVAERYAGSPAGAEAGMLIAQLLLERGDAAGAVTGLTQLAEKTKSGPSAAAVRGLLADALSQANKPAEAAAEYERAAALTTMANEKAFLMSKAGYAFMTAGKRAEATRVFQALAEQQDAIGLADEAKVRLGELAAAPKG